MRKIFDAHAFWLNNQIWSGGWPYILFGAERMRNRNGRYLAVLVAAISSSAAFGQLSKVDTLLQEDGFQLQAAVNTGAPYYYDGHINSSNQFVGGLVQANYTAPSYSGTAIFEDSNYPISSELNGPWAIWNVDEGDLPDQVAGDIPHLNNLISMAIGDEQNWESDPSVYATVVSEFQQVNADPNYNHTIVYTNNYLGQVQDNAAGVTSFIQAAHPDMLTFDTYPFQTGNASATDDSQILNVGYTSWYTELRFYRDVTLDNSYQSSNPTYSVDWGLYRQVYATDDGTRTPGATEYALETFSAMAFNAKYLSDFVFNGNASQLFTDQNQDATTPLYAAVQPINQEAANIGRSMVYLTPISAGTNPDPEWYDGTGTSDILFLRGQQLSTGTPSSFTKNYNTLPNGFVADGTSGATLAYSKWTYQANDKYLTGWGVTNIGNTVNFDPNQNIYLPGDALVSWFRPLGESQTTAYNNNDIYFMVVNALATPTGTAQQCEQYIQLTFEIPNAASQLVQYIDPITGAVDTISVTSGTAPTTDPDGTILTTVVSGRLRVNMYLGGGEAMLFKIDNGTPFLVPEPSTLSLIGLTSLTLLRRRRTA
jgi:hypothetical protein